MNPPLLPQSSRRFFTKITEKIIAKNNLFNYQLLMKVLCYLFNKI